MNLLDVRLPENFDAGHVPDSVNNPVFQMGFVDRVPEEWSKDDPLQVIGEDGESLEASMAAEKLSRAGYTQVSVLEGGYRGWASEESTSADSFAPVPDGHLAVDLEASELQWTGRNLLNRHYGTLKFSAAELEFSGGHLAGGTFRIDWDTLTCTDLAGSPMHDVLMAHLKDHDFFDVEVFDSPSVILTKVSDVSDSSPGAPNLEISADLTMKGVTKPVAFSATSGLDAEGHFAFQAAFDFDRTDWDVKYGSGRFFKNLGMHLVNDRIEIGLKVVTA